MRDPNHYLLLIFLLIPIILLITRLILIWKTDGNAVRPKIGEVLNLAIIYSLAFNIVFFIQELFLVLGKNWIGLTAYLYHNNHDWDGTDPLTSLMQGMGGWIIIIFGLLMFILLEFIKNKSVPHLLLVLIAWLGLQGLMQGLPQIQTAFLSPGTDMGQAFGYLGLNGNVGLVIGLFTTILLVLSVRYGLLMFMRIGLIESGSTKTQLKSTLWRILLPAVIGCALIIPFRILPWDRGFMQFFSLLSWIPWLLFFSMFSGKGSVLRTNHKLSYGLVLALVLLLLLFQLVLSPGVKFLP